MSEMNETNHRNEIEPLEARLRSWVPRRPSARVERRLVAAFETAAAAQAAPHPVPEFRLSWLAPATAGLLLVFAFFSQHPAITTISLQSSAPMVALALSNQSAAAWIPGSFAHAQNSLPAETFEWTNGRGPTSSIGSPWVPRGRN